MKGAGVGKEDGGARGTLNSRDSIFRIWDSGVCTLHPRGLGYRAFKFRVQIGCDRGG